MKYEPELFEPYPGVRPPTASEVYLSYAQKVEMRNAHLPGKSWLYWGYFFILCSLATLPSGGVFVCAPLAAFLLFHYLNRHASYRKAKDPIPYAPRSNR